LVKAALVASFLGLAAASSASALPGDADVAIRPVRTVPATTALPCGDSCGGEAIKRLVIGAVARPAVRRPATAPAVRQVVRPTVLVPGQIRSGRR
jgi:hypothetical protein